MKNIMHVFAVEQHSCQNFGPQLLYHRAEKVSFIVNKKNIIE